MLPVLVTKPSKFVDIDTYIVPFIYLKESSILNKKCRTSIAITAYRKRMASILVFE